MHNDTHVVSLEYTVAVFWKCQNVFSQMLSTEDSKCNFYQKLKLYHYGVMYIWKNKCTLERHPFTVCPWSPCI